MNESPISLRDETGVERFRGTQSPGGGSVPQGVVQSADFLFTEEATAGVYTAPPLPLPENAILVDIQWWPVSSLNWAADTVVLDASDPAIGSLISAQDVKTGLSTGVVVSAAQTVILQQPYVFPNIASFAEPSGGGELDITITTTIAVPPVVPTAVLRVRVLYIVPPTPVAAVFA